MKRLSECWFWLAVLAAPFEVGCQDRKPLTQPFTATTIAPDAEAQAVALLESQQDSAQCRTVLEQLDSLPSSASRPAFSDSERNELARYLRLTPAESAELARSNFSQTDAQYLSECLLIRAGVRSLRIDSRPPLERAKLSFEWICRSTYIDDRVTSPANPWMTLQAGWGLSLSRAYAILAAWQQMGLDGCLVGPPALKDFESVAPNPTNPTVPPIFAPVRACGVKIDKELYLFDPMSGRPFYAADGKGILTIAAVRAKPELVPEQQPADEAKDWRPYLAPPLAAVSRRMEWLQRLNPGNMGVKLFTDVAKQRAAFLADLPGIPCHAWNPENDQLTATRVLGRYVTQEPDPGTPIVLRDFYRWRGIPFDKMPKTTLRGTSLNHVLNVFAEPFASLRSASNSPRDLFIRGQFQDALAALEGTKRLIENAQSRMQQDKGLQKDFELWAERFDSLFASVNRARLQDPAAMPAAARALDNFRNTPANRDIERAFIFGTAAKPLGAEVTYLIAACVHERAERAELEKPGQSAAHWKNASEWWGRFLDASAEAQSPFPAREPHARALQARCRQFTPK